ncbi:homoserine dehydrogenase NAD-binding protein [Thermocrinis albus DSM 14484]|uniref:Homoserine dehydrogenase NAD-binding protein n=1 Tax=Thermocrinis albus (strain DSM 14484 / JCM 11386 / HI 11/12) TaxID=638303 RepID=D3SML7_THEAH|nr:homoserine kinase [Thermocrinis albus]ADC89997.1 homoserine dehydrogenase NAD-binding protein [Thermocrinis albus DSM 14484]
MRRVHVAIAGLGRVGSQFLEALLAVPTENVKVVAVAEKREDTESVKRAKEAGIAYFKDARDMLRALEDYIDVLFDLTGDAVVHTELQEILASTGNTKTVLVPEPVAYLIWSIITGGRLAYPR